MAYTAGFSVSVGDPTKASDVSVLAANDDYLKAAVDAKAVLSGSTNDTVATVTGANALIGEADLTFASNKLTVFGTTGTGTATAGVLNLSTRETTVVDADQLGRIDFQAPAETGADALLVTASIYAEADVAFDATNNATDIVFATAHDGAAAERFRVTSQGEIGLAGANYGTDGQVITSTGAGTAVAWESIPAGTTLSGSTPHTVATVTGANALEGEAALTFDGSTLTLSGNQVINDGYGMVIGGSAQFSTGVVAELQVYGAGSHDSAISVSRFEASSDHGHLYFLKSRNASAGSFAIVQDSDNLGAVHFMGDNGATYNSEAAGIRAQVDGTPSASSMPGRLVFQTTAASAVAPTERMRIGSTGRVDIGAPDATVSSSADGLVVNDGANAGMTIYSTGTSSGQMKLSLTNAEGADAGAALVYSNSADALIFNVNGATERMRISSAGNVTVSSNVASGYAAHFDNVWNDANRYGIKIQAGAYDASGVTYYLNALDGNGDQVGYIENNSGTFRLVDGSDERGKEDIVDTTVDGLATINAIEVKDFTRKKSGQRVSAGFIAQQMKTAYPSAVAQPDDVPEVLYDRDVAAVLYEEGDDLPAGKSVGDVKTAAAKKGDVQTEGYTPWMGVGKDSLIGPLVKAVQQLSAKITALESA